jgi:hypothetical protein
MPGITKDALALHGGCYCGAVRYMINIPPFKERPVLYSDAENSGRGEVRSPVISFDHCNDCRKAAGNIAPIWYCPSSLYAPLLH